MVELMSIPIRCMSCGKLLADKWEFYVSQVNRYSGTNEPVVFDGRKVPETNERKVMDTLGITRYCCRKSLLTHVDTM